MLCEDYNFRTNIKELIFDYLDIWEREKKTKTITGVHYHGSKKGDEVNETLYLNPITKEYMTEELAFESFIALKLTKSQKQIIEFKNSNNTTVNVPIIEIDNEYFVAHELLGAKMYENYQAVLEECEVVDIEDTNTNADDDVVRGLQFQNEYQRTYL